MHNCLGNKKLLWRKMQETRLHQSSRAKLLVVILQLVISHYALVHEIKAGTCKPFLTGKEVTFSFWLTFYTEFSSKMTYWDDHIIRFRPLGLFYSKYLPRATSKTSRTNWVWFSNNYSTSTAKWYLKILLGFSLGFN